MTAVPVSWLTTASVIKGSASRAFFTEASQCLHIIPLIFTVFVMVLFLSFFCSSLIDSVIVRGIFAALSGLSFAGSFSLNRFSRRAFMQTVKLERLMAAAPIIGLIFHPKRPAASGMQIRL